MRSQRIYQPGSYQSGDEITLDPIGSQHLVRVLRYQPGDRLIVFNGQGQSFDALVTQANPNAAKVKLEQAINSNTESALRIHLGLAISKGEHMDYAIQKAVEAGVSEITPILSKHTVVKLNEKRSQSRILHWQGIIRHACEQSGRCVLPILHPVREFNAYLSMQTSELKLILDPVANNTLKKIEDQPGAVRLLIGPEGGFSTDEIHQALKSGYVAIRLGPRVLRSETAAVAACIGLQALWGDLI